MQEELNGNMVTLINSMKTSGQKNSIASRGFLVLYYILLKIRSASKIRGLLFEAAIDLNWKIFQLFNANVSLQQFMIST